MPRTRIVGYVTDVVPNYSLQEFKRMFRMSIDSFQKIVVYLRDCKELTTRGEGGREPICVEKQLLLVLWFLSGNDTINKVADRFGISESSVILSRTRVLDAILHNLLPKFINWSENPHGVEEKFRIRNGFPGILGALDGTHIAIKAPKQNPQCYINRKKFHSLQLQAVCNADMMFIDCFCGFPGSCHDSRVLKQSPLWQHGQHLPNRYHIIADGGYPLKQWLLTPFRDNGHLTQEQRNFNFLLSSNRVIVERSFGLLKGRFRRLHYLDTKSIQTSVKLVMCACVLHNICLLTETDIEEFIEMDNLAEDDDILPFALQDNDVEGHLKRNKLTNQLRVQRN